MCYVLYIVLQLIVGRLGKPSPFASLFCEYPNSFNYQYLEAVMEN